MTLHSVSWLALLETTLVEGVTGSMLTFLVKHTVGHSQTTLLVRRRHQLYVLLLPVVMCAVTAACRGSTVHHSWSCWCCGM
jgi:hypothetical protein